jgi:hypothetical protein
MPHQALGRAVIMAGAVLILIGGFIMLSARFGLWDKIPGNFRWQKGAVTIYFPLGISIIASLLLSLIFYFMGRK